MSILTAPCGLFEKGILQFDSLIGKKSKTIMCFKSILDFTVLFLLPAAFFHPSLSAFHLAACHSVDAMRLYDSHKNYQSYRSSAPEGTNYNPLYGRGQSVTDNLIWRSSLIYFCPSHYWAGTFHLQGTI